jgi:hypothetical protein
MRNRSGNPRFAFGKTEADHGNRGAAGSPRSVARRAFGRALASVPRGNSGSVGVPVAETEWRTENVGSRHSSGAASREKANQKVGGAVSSPRERQASHKAPPVVGCRNPKQKRGGAKPSVSREKNAETKTQSTRPVLVKRKRVNEERQQGPRLWRRESRDKITGTLAPHVKTQLGRASARTRRGPNHQQPEKKSSRGKNPTSRSDQLFGPRSKPRTHKRNSQIWFQQEQDANSKYLIEN